MHLFAFRKRTVLVPPGIGGSPCPGGLIETRGKARTSTPCVVGEWAFWSKCDRTCGGGQKTRERSDIALNASRSNSSKPLHPAGMRNIEVPRPNANEDKRGCEAEALEVVALSGRLRNLPQQEGCYSELDEFY
eukprot:g22291.t1